MIRTLLTTTALAALMGTAVIAQDAPATPEAPATDAPATEAPATDAPATDAPATDAPATDAPATDAAPAEEPAAPAGEVTEGEDVDTGAAETTEVDEPWDISEGYTAADSDNLATQLIGQPVYSSSGEDAENIGDVSDLVFSESGQIEAVVIGVGGFLGIGEKQVAVDFDALEFTVAADNTERWVLATTAEALEGAPEFVWAEDEPADAAVPTDGMAPAAPADGAAPAAPATQ